MITPPLGTRAPARVEPLERRVLFAAGDLDSTFGGGDGVADTDLAGGATAITVQADGSVVAAGATLTEPGGFLKLALVRYRRDGALDPTFAPGGGDGDGRTIVPDLGTPSLVEVGADGKIVVAFETLPLHGDILTVARFNTDGSPDTDFGERGRASELVGHGFDVTALRVLDDGKILVGVRVFSPGGTYDGGVPFNPDGSLDSSSPRAAVAPEDPGLGRIAPFDVRVPDPFAPGVSKAAEARSPARAAATQADGKIVALAQAAVDGAVFDLDLAVLRFNADGTPDPTFAHAVHFPGDPDTYAIAVQPGTGRILYAQGDHFAVVGLASGPPLDAPREVSPADVTPPTATVVDAPRVTSAATPAVTFTVRYEDDVALRGDTFDGTDVRVTAPDGTSTLARLESAAPAEGTPADGPRRDVTYSYAPPAGAFRFAMNGTYRISVEPGAVTDTSGNPVPVVPDAGTFTVDVPFDPATDTPPDAANLVPGAVTAKLGRAGALFVGGRPRGKIWLTLANAGRTRAAGPVEVRLFASDDATLDQSDVQLLNTKRRVVLPPGRSRRIALRPGKSSLFLPAPAYYLFARVDAGDAIVEASQSDNVSPAPAAAIPLTAPAGKRSARHPESLFASGAVLPG